MPFEGLPPQRPTYKRPPHVDPALPASERIARTNTLNEERLRKGAAFRAKFAEQAKQAPKRLEDLREKLLSPKSAKRPTEGPELSYGDLVDVDLPPSDDRMDRYDQLRADRIKNESEQLAYGAQTRFRNKMIAKHRFAPSAEAERNLWEAADAGPAFPQPSEYDFSNWASVPTTKQNIDESIEADLTELSPRELAQYHRDQELSREVSAFQRDLKKPRAAPPSLEKKFATKQEMAAARYEREQRESGGSLNDTRERDAQNVQIRNLKANQQAIVEYPRAQVRALQAKTESIASDFEAKTGVPIEAYLAGTLGTMDRLRISAQNIGSALGQPFRFVKGIFAGGRPSDEGGKELSPQAIVEQYEHARTQAEEAQAALVSAEVNAQRIQDQIDQLEMTSADYRAKKDADWDRAEHARNLATLGRSSGGAANLFRSDRSQLRADTPVAMETTDPSEWDSSAPRTAHRDLSYNFNPLTSSPSLRKLAPLYAKPGPSRTNGIKGYEAYDNVMDIPGFEDRYNNLSDEEEIPTRASAISPESAPWSDERPSFVDTLERVGAHMGVDRNTGMAIADTTYELLENDANEERASQADRRFRLLGQYITHINTIEQDLIGERPAEELYRALVRPETHSALRPLIVESLKKLDIQSLPKNDRVQLNEVATLLLTALQAKAMTIPPPAQRKNNPPTFVRTADKKLDDDAPEVSLSDEFDPDDFSDILDNLDNKA
jgi:hypothetical protein